MNPSQHGRAPRVARIARWGSMLAVLALPMAASADGLNTNSPLLPPLGGEYLSPAKVHATYNGPALQIVLSDIKHAGFADIGAIPVPGVGTQETFQSEASGHVAVDFGPDSFFDVFFDITLTGPTQVLLKNGYTPGATGTFDTEMLQLNLTGNTPFGPALIRESPTLPSLGQTSITPIGGGQFHIDSFFDVFTELSLDGGASWIPSAGSTRVTLVPEPATLTVLAFGVLLLAGVMRARRRF